jgi:hypothetical protein
MYKNTVSKILWDTLIQLMGMKVFLPFRLVGGTALSLQIGHRKSEDIDLFTDAIYGSIDFVEIDNVLKNTFPYVDMRYNGNSGMGKCYEIGINDKEKVKLDVFYTDKFIRSIVEYETVRMADIEDIAAMKIEAIAISGRKKDFWDIHELLNMFSIQQIFDFYFERYPYSFSLQEIKEKMIDFKNAETNFNPICLRGKYWELVMLDIQEVIKKSN